MNIKLFNWRFALLLPLLLSACSQESTPKGITLDPLSFAGWEQQLGKYKGDIVVADLWATWCKPCIDRFPKMVDLHGKYKDSGVTFVSVNFDDSFDTETMEKAHNF